MKILIAMNEFKGSLTSSELNKIIKGKIKKELPKSNIDSKCIADGGDGFLSLFQDFEKRTFETISSSGKIRKVEYLINKEKKQAVIEIAEVVGLKYLDEKEKNPYKTTTLGIGRLIAYLLDKEIKSFIIGLGGSSTNDCGIGMMSALGYKFLDKNNNICENGISDLKNIVKVENSKANNKLKEAEFIIICDVDNTLYGNKGATYIYSEQKGLAQKDFEIVDNYMKKFSEIIFKKLKVDFSTIEGSGAAGGLGYAFMTFMNAKIYKGSEFAISYLDLEEKIKNVDIVITGEGKLDKQSFMGKVPIEVARVAKKYNKKVIFLAGSIFDDELESLNFYERNLIDASFSIQRGIITLDAAMKKELATKNLERTVEQVCSLLKFNYE